MRGLNEYVFRSRDVAVVSPHLASRLLGKVSDMGSSTSLRVRVTLDLGLTYVEGVIEGNSLVVEGFRISLSNLRQVASSTAVHAVLEGGEVLEPIQLYDYSARKFYKLRAVGEAEAPTLEINGIHMHRIKETTPWRDALAKVRTLGRLRGAKVLDICTGLGYTAITALRRGAAEVVSVEVDQNVLRVAEVNPWSRDLSRVRIVVGDAAEVIKELPDASFTHAIHDPPRFQMAGHLYSAEFYAELYRVLKPGGKLFHYVGEPGRKRGRSYVGGVRGRLVKAGFIVLKWDPVALGFVAVKPS